MVHPACNDWPGPAILARVLVAAAALANSRLYLECWLAGTDPRLARREGGIGVARGFCGKRRDVRRALKGEKWVAGTAGPEVVDAE